MDSKPSTQMANEKKGVGESAESKLQGNKGFVAKLSSYITSIPLFQLFLPLKNHATTS